MGPNAKTISRVAGELSVIIAGVLIALAADRWLEDLDARSMESEYVAMLLQDLEADSAAFAEQIQERQARIEWGTSLHGQLADPSRTIAEPGRFLRALNYYSAWVPTRVNQATWSELLATGRLGLLRGADLRHRLGQYYNAAESRSLGFEQMDRELAAIKASIEQALEPEARRVINGATGPPITGADAQAVLEQIRSSRNLRASLAAAEERHRNILRSSQSSLTAATSLLSIVRSYQPAS